MVPLLFSVNGSSVNPRALGQSSTGDDARLSAVYAEFGALHARVPLRRLSVIGSAIAATATLTTFDGRALMHVIELDGRVLNPIVTVSMSDGLRWQDLVASRPLIEAVIALVQSAQIGTFNLEVT